jgi:hypothetical protein
MKWLNEKGDPCEPPSVVVESCGLGRDLPHQLDELCRQLRVVRILRAEHSLAQHLDVSLTSGFGTTRTWPNVRLESAFGGRAEVEVRSRQVRFGPISEMAARVMPSDQ